MSRCVHSGSEARNVSGSAKLGHVDPGYSDALEMIDFCPRFGICYLRDSCSMVHGSDVLTMGPWRPRPRSETWYPSLRCVRCESNAYRSYSSGMDASRVTERGMKIYIHSLPYRCALDAYMRNHTSLVLLLFSSNGVIEAGTSSFLYAPISEVCTTQMMPLIWGLERI